MPKYLFEGRYNVEGTKGVAKEGGSGRHAAIKKMFEGLGGKLESLHVAFGDVDVFAIARTAQQRSCRCSLSRDQPRRHRDRTGRGPDDPRGDGQGQ